ncbi:zinc ribbon domain-containing protein [Treponema zioleckii]|uniref:zinc ribbon domain-containing protein n=1 Tax=Treponema zioleckii TaxID=331680 RepID=UPI00168B1777|nr:zinc ribbon domain-containing protein [Treponema zioleckii]
MDSEKKLKKCASCGNEFDVAFAFCPKCGSKYVEEKTLKKCASCGTEFDSAFEFCPNCGTKYEPVGDNPAESQNAEQETVEAENSEAESASEEKPAKKGKKLRLILILFGILAVLGGGIAFFMVQQQNHLKEIELQRQQHERELAEEQQRERELEAKLEQKRYEEERIAQEKARAKQVLVNEDIYVANWSGEYLKFTLPYDSTFVEIDADVGSNFHSVEFIVASSLEDATAFTHGNHYYYVSGTYKKGQGYFLSTSSLTPGATYYFCVWNPTLGILSQSQYKISAKVTSYNKYWTKK